MADAVTEQIAAHVKTALLAAPQIAGIGARVERNREDAYTREDGDSVNIKSEEEQLRPHSDEVDDEEFILSVTVYTGGADWETRANAYAVLIARRVFDHAYTGLRLARIRRVEGDWGGDDVDATPGKRTLKFAFRFLVMAADMTRQP